MSATTGVPGPEGFDRFGPLLRYLRVRARLAQRDLAIAVGYSEAHISRLEQGQRRPDPVAVRAHFLAPLDLLGEPELAARLVALAEAESGPGPAAAPPPHPSEPPQHAAAPGNLLATKLYRPQPRPGAIARERLLRRLDLAHTVPLTLVATPAGFGKSTLVAMWLARAHAAAGAPRPFSSAWLSLDAGDGELVVFLRHLVVALQGAAPGVGADTLALLAAPETPPLRALLTPLLNDLAADGRHVVLVLDDYHLVPGRAIHEAVAFLLERPQPNLHLLIATRADPPLPLARLRVRGQLLELRVAELRFTSEEAAAFLQQTMDLGLSPGEAALLDRRTEGWAAGLQLAALALREQADRGTFIAAFAGSNRYVLDYLAEEVLDSLPSHLRGFLLRTSLLERLCGELCDAVMGIAEEDEAGSYSRHILAELERLNLFLISLDSERRWYRYHHLFADVLRARLRAGTRPEQLAELYRRANAWLWRSGQFAEAITCALAAPSYALAAEQIEAVSRQLLGRGESVQLLEWLHALPDALLDERPALTLACAWALFHTNRWNAVEPYLARAQAGLPADAERLAAASPLGAEIVALRGCIGAYRDASPEALAWCELALRALPEDDLRVRCAVLTSLGTASNTVGDVEASHRVNQTAIAVGTAGRYLFSTVHAYYYDALTLTSLGRFSEVDERYASARRFAAEMGAPLSPTLGMVALVQGRAAYERNDLAAAQEYLSDALARCERLGYPESLADAHVWCARLAHALGDGRGAVEHMRQAREIVGRGEVHPVFVSEYVYSRMVLLLAKGDLGAAEALARERGLSPAMPIDYRRQPEIIALGRLLLAQGRGGAAVDLLRRFLAMDTIGPALGVQLEALVPLALALAGAGDSSSAGEAIARALAIAEPEGLVRIFISEGAPMAGLLRAAQGAGTSPRFCGRLLAAMTSDT